MPPGSLCNQLPMASPTAATSQNSGLPPKAECMNTIDRFRALAAFEEEVALNAEAEARDARRRKELLLRLCDSDNDTVWNSVDLFDTFDAVLGATNNASGPRCALGVCFNIFLVVSGHRPGFCIQPCDFAPGSKHVYSRALKLAELLPQLDIVDCKIGSIIVRSEDRDAVAEKLAAGAASDTLSTAVGEVLGYCFAGELSDFHRQSGRFSVVLHIEQSPDENRQEITPSSCVMAMVGTHESQHKLETVMVKALQFRDVASCLGRGLRVTFQVKLFDENEFRPCNHSRTCPMKFCPGSNEKKTCAHVLAPRTTVVERPVHKKDRNGSLSLSLHHQEQEHDERKEERGLEEHLNEKEKHEQRDIKSSCCQRHRDSYSNRGHTLLKKCSSSTDEGGIEVLHDGHRGIVVGNELHCEHADSDGNIVGCHSFNSGTQKQEDALAKLSML